MIDAWGWPQWVMFGLVVFTTTKNIVSDARDVDRFVAAVVGFYIVAVLHFGGFW